MSASQNVRSNDARSDSPATPELSPEQMRELIATLTAERDELKSRPATAVAKPDLTAGRRSVERVFYYVTAALRAGIDPIKIAELYDARAEQLDKNPNTCSKRVCRELLDMIEAVATPEPEKSDEPEKSE